MKCSTRQLTLCAVLTALALALSYLENFLPLNLLIPLPGIKLGLANIVTVYTVFTMGPGAGCLVLGCRIFLGAVFAGNFSSILYSAAGGAVAILITILLRKVLREKQIWVAGVFGALGHSLGQMAMAVLVTQTPGIAVYLPIMCAASIVTGTITGLAAQFTAKRLPN